MAALTELPADDAAIVHERLSTACQVRFDDGDRVGGHVPRPLITDWAASGPRRWVAVGKAGRHAACRTRRLAAAWRFAAIHP